MSRPPCVVAMGGGGFSMEPDDLRLDRYLLSLTERERPRVLFVPTASGDSSDYVTRFFEAFTSLGCQPGVLRLFRRGEGDLRERVLAQDLVYVGGGNTANMLAVWRVHGLDAVLREAWEAGVVLAGLSAGSLCWFQAGVTDSFGQALGPLHDGLGLLSGSHCPHYDGEERRRPRYRELVARDELPPGLAVDDGCAVRFGPGGERLEVVASREGVAAYAVAPDGAGGVSEERLQARLLPAG